MTSKCGRRLPRHLRFAPGGCVRLIADRLRMIHQHAAHEPGGQCEEMPAILQCDICLNQT